MWPSVNGELSGQVTVVTSERACAGKSQRGCARACVSHGCEAREQVCVRGSRRTDRFEDGLERYR